MKRARLELDYIAPPYRSPWLGVGLLCVALAVAGLLTARNVSVKNRLEALSAAQGLLASERPRPTVPKEHVAEQMQQAERVVRELTLPWGPIVEAVESASMPGVRVLQMQPDAQHKLLRLTAEASDQEAMFEYVRRIGHAKALDDAWLVSHRVDNDDPAHPVEFSLQASLKETQ